MTEQRPDILSAMTDLREVAAVLERIPDPPPAVRRVLDRLRCYEHGAANGLTLEQALALAPGRGGEAWWTLEERQRRDAELVAMAREFFPDIGIEEQARRIAAEALRYQTTGWRLERDRPSDTLPDPKRRRLHRALSAAGDRGIPGQRQLQNILEKSGVQPEMKSPF